MSDYYVSRQSNYYDDGAHSVEIAAQLDYSSPGALVDRYDGEGGEYADPREAAEVAIAVARAWRADSGRREVPFRIFTIAGNAICYPTVADAMTMPELRAWAIAAWEAMPKCDACGDAITGEAWHLCEDPDAGTFCREYCCESALATLDDSEAI